MTEVVTAQDMAGDFRRALAHYPTGVAVVTARQAEGAPVGMVVGTFTSVSLDPPLVGFLPDRSSTTWPLIREAGRFCVNVLSAGQEHVCRSFVNKAPDRFDRYSTTDAPSGSPLLVGTALWIDCDIEDVLPTGDHDMVVGRVRDLGVPEEAGLPLIFLRGGYGSPSLPSIQAEGPGLSVPLRLADRVRPEAEAVARDLGLECLVSAVVGDSVVSLAVAGIGSSPGGSDTHVGRAFPLAAPLASLFVAWGTDEEQEAWRARGRRLAGVNDSDLGHEELEAARALGYEVYTGRAQTERFIRVVENPTDTSGLSEVLRVRREPGLRASPDVPIERLTDVSVIAAPVRDRQGRVVLTMHVMGFSGDESPERLRVCRDRLLAGTARASQLVSA